MGALKDIRDIVIDTSKPKPERIREYLSQMENPYEYMDGGVHVILKFADTTETLTDRLISYASCMNGNM